MSAEYVPEPLPAEEVVDPLTPIDGFIEVKPVVDDKDENYVSTDLVREYLKQIGKVALIDAAKEVELAKRIEAGLFACEKLDLQPDIAPQLRKELEWIKDDGKRAMDHMLEANLRLVVNLAKHYTGRGLALLDLIQDGNVGLVHAVEKFDYKKGISSQPMRRGGFGKRSHDLWQTIAVQSVYLYIG